MRGALILWIIVFAFGLLTGERYGAPPWATAITDRGFEAVEERLGLPSKSEENDEAASAAATKGRAS